LKHPNKPWNTKWLNTFGGKMSFFGSTAEAKNVDKRLKGEI
jgi:hypothetical protein